jgi:hypothetical protein
MNKMKILLGMFFLISASLVFGQKNIKSEYTKMLQGTWKVDSLEIGSFNLSPEYEEIVRQKMPEIIAMTEVQFSARKKYYKRGFEGETEGNWEVSKDGEFIIVKQKNEAKLSKTRIIKITEDKLIIAPEDPSSANSKAYLYKVK